MEDIKKMIEDFPESNSTRIPSCKSINEPPGLFVANDNMIISKWNLEEMESGVPHFIVTGKVDPVTNKFIEIPGRLFNKPKLLILRCSPSLKMDATSKYITGKWNAKEDAIFKEQKLAYCVKRFLLFFLNDDCKKMHTKPIQLTARGNFMYHFDVMFTAFCLYMFNLNDMYREKLFLHTDGEDKDCFIASCFVFQPVFESKNVGGAGKMAKACITIGYDQSNIKFKPDQQHKDDFKNYSRWYEPKTLSPSLSISHQNDAVVYEKFDL